MSERATSKRPRATVADRLRAIEEAPVGEKIARVRPVSTGEQWTVTLEGKASFRLAGSVLTELQLGVGEEWTPELAVKARALQGVAFARHDALMIVQRRAVTRKGLIDKLAQKGHARPDADEAAAALERVGLIDDARVADSAARSAVRKGGVGKRLVEQKLRAKGVGPEAAKEAAERAMEGRDVLADALGLARKKARSSMGRGDRRSATRKVAAALARRGFDVDVCRKATKRALDELEGYDDDD